ncbi:MMS19 nucleotide excision repair protein-like protein [Gryllus bimaculatus]|nr:MMS19 nucleotide excision repair protein-like protein [Gryllus bimaculatus]
METPWLCDKLEEIIRTDENFVTKSSDIATDVICSKLKLVTLVERLGGVLTDANPDIRRRGTEVLAEVLQSLPKDFLNETELNFISAFFVDRLIDHYFVQPAALKGIFAVVQMEHTPRDIAVRVLKTILQGHIQCQTLKPSDRRNVYQIFQLFIHNFTEDLKALGPDFVYGFMNVIDQEKDARNLTVVFEILPFFIKTFSLGHLTEEMFEIISCYFPVDYRPEYSDCPVTRQDLADGLQKCLIASPDFGEFCIPLLIEKLDSKLKLAKLDSFKVLTAGCEVFPANVIRTYLLDLWRIIQHEVLPGTDKDVRELGLGTLKAIVKSMSAAATERQDSKVLTNVTSFVLNGNSELSPIWEELPSLLLGAAQFETPEVCKEGFHGIAVSGRIFNVSSREILYDLLKKSMDKEEDEMVRSEMLMCLKRFSCLYPEEVLEKIVEKKLKDINSWPEDGCKHMNLVLESLCEVANTEPFTDLIVPCILQLIIESFSLEKCNIGMKCLRKLLESSGESSIYKYMYLQCDVVSRLISWWLKGIAEEKYNAIFENEELLCHSAKIVKILIKNQERRSQAEVVSALLPQVINANCGLTNNGFTRLPLTQYSPKKHPVFIVLLEALIGSVQQEISIPDIHQLIIDLTQLAIRSSHSLTQLSACRLSANLINKAPDDENLVSLLQEISKKYQDTVLEDTKSLIERQNTALVIVWITKSLVMRGHSEMNKWVEYLIEVLGNPTVGQVAAEGFSLIMKDDVEYLDSESFCNVKILFRQRFFSFSPKLIEAFHDAPLDSKANYLIALGHMLQGVPQEVLLMNLEKMVPLLVESLQQSEAVLLVTTLDTLHSVLKNSDLALQHHLQTFIPRILILTTFQKSMRVRMKALQCIYEIYKYPTSLLLPFKNKVLKVLGECLDDPKRLVRKAAVQARSHWFLVGTKSKRR